MSCVLRRLEFLNAHVRELDGHLTLSISLPSADSRVLNRSSRPAIRYRQDDPLIGNREVLPREFQEMRRYTLGGYGVREEDLVAILYFLLASAYGKALEVEGHKPEILARRILAVDGRDIEIIKSYVESPKQID